MEVPNLFARIEATVDQYCLAWSCEDHATREQLLLASMSPLARYCDPNTAADLSLTELQAHIAGVVARRPGARVVRTSRVDGHHNYGRFLWGVELPDGTMLPESIDFIEWDASGLLLRVTGFFGTLEPSPMS